MRKRLLVKDNQGIKYKEPSSQFQTAFKKLIATKDKISKNQPVTLLANTTEKALKTLIVLYKVGNIESIPTNETYLSPEIVYKMRQLLKMLTGNGFYHSNSERIVSLFSDMVEQVKTAEELSKKMSEQNTGIDQAEKIIGSLTEELNGIKIDIKESKNEVSILEKFEDYVKISQHKCPIFEDLKCHTDEVIHASENIISSNPVEIELTMKEEDLKSEVGKLLKKKKGIFVEHENNQMEKEKEILKMQTALEGSEKSKVENELSLADIISELNDIKV